MDEQNRLLEVIAAEPDSVENWIVYADWLLERDDPRGELITLELAIEAGLANDEAKERHRKLARDEAAWLSPRLEAEAHHLDLELWRGFVRSAKVFGPEDDPPTSEVLAALFADPHACVLRALDINRHFDICDGQLCESLRSLEVIPHAAELDIASPFPNLSSLALRRVYQIVGDEEMPSADAEQLTHPTLTELDGSCVALQTGQFDLPNLEALSLLDLYVAIDPMAFFGPRGILSEPPPHLAKLEIQDASVEFVQALRRSRLQGQLRSLSFGLDGATLDEIERDPEAFRNLDVRIHGSVATREERDSITARAARLFANAQFNIYAGDEPIPEAQAPVVEPVEPVATGSIADAFARFAERIRARGGPTARPFRDRR